MKQKSISLHTQGFRVLLDETIRLQSIFEKTYWPMMLIAVANVGVVYVRPLLSWSLMFGYLCGKARPIQCGVVPVVIE